MFHSLPATRQHDISDCGAACLHTIARYHGSRLPISRIRQFASTDEQGTNVLGLLEAAERLGFEARAVRTSMDALPRLPGPFIAHVVLPGGLHHYVVVYHTGKGRVRVMDPAEGTVRRIPLDEFIDRWSGVAVLLAPSAHFTPETLGSSPLKRFWELVRPHRIIMLQALVGAALYTLLGLATAIYVQKVVDHVLVDGNRNLLNLLSIALLLILLVQAYVGSTKSLLSLRAGQMIDASLIFGYYRHLLRLPQRFFDTMRVGEIISRVNDAVKIRAFLNDVSLDLAVSALVVSFSFALLFAYSWRLAVILLLVIAGFALLYQVTNRLNRRVLRRSMEHSAELESQLVESISAIATIKRFGLEESACRKTEERFVRLLRSIYDTGLVWICSSSGTDFLSRLAILLGLWIGAGFVITGALTPGELMSCYALIGYLTGPATRLVTANRTIQDALIAGDRLFEIMDLEGGSDSQGGLALPNEDSIGIQFEDLTFRYGARRPVFENFNLQAYPGQMTAIVGESGSGKSTLLALAQRLYPIQHGRIVIGGYDIRHLDERSLRERVVAVPQELHLFAGNVVENIAPGEFEPDMLRLLKICDRLGITEFVEQLPLGFQTDLGENGVTLSGGQRQRLAIARALYRSPAILLLDEATSSLDSASEARVRTTLRGLCEEGRTVLLIAHRLPSIMDADRIIVLRQGRVVEEGRHEELLRKAGEYARLWRDQYPFTIGMTGSADHAQIHAGAT